MEKKINKGQVKYWYYRLLLFIIFVVGVVALMTFLDMLLGREEVAERIILFAIGFVLTVVAGTLFNIKNDKWTYIFKYVTLILALGLLCWAAIEYFDEQLYMALLLFAGVVLLSGATIVSVDLLRINEDEKDDVN